MRLINIKTKEYPVSLIEFRKRFPMAPASPNINDFLKYGYAMVRPTDPPATISNQYIMEDVPEPITKRMFRQVWALVDLETETPFDKIIGLCNDLGIDIVTSKDEEILTISVNQKLCFDEKGNLLNQIEAKI